MADDERTNDALEPDGSERLLRVTPGYVEYYFGGSVPRDAAPADDVDGAGARGDAGDEMAGTGLDDEAEAPAPAADDGVGGDVADEPQPVEPTDGDGASTADASDAVAVMDGTDTEPDEDDACAEQSDETSADGHDEAPLSDGTEDGGEMERTERGLPGWLDLIITLACTLVLVFFIRTFVAEAYEVPTGSMLETIQLGDRLVGEKVSLHWRKPQEGDIVTFADPDGEDVTLIKRVIATEGQVVDLQDGSVIVDGEVRKESYTLGKPSYPLDRYAGNLTEKVTFPLTVPEGHIWVMGDNRTNSLDSRYFGPVPIDSVTSIGVFIFWPPSDAQLL